MTKLESLRKSLFIFSLLLLFLSACSNEGSETSANEAADSESQNVGLDNFDDNSSVSMEESETGTQDQDTDRVLNTETSQNFDQMIIYTGELSIIVDNYTDTQSLIEEEIAQYGGFIAETSVYQHGENESQSGYITVRIPQKYFYPFLNELEANSIEVLEKSTNGNDVTEEFVDLDSRLKSKEIVEERLTSFLENAENTEDLLVISQDLSEVQEEIEQLVGRMNYLEDRVSLSTVTVHMEERAVNVSSLHDRETLNTLERAQSLFMDTINTLITIFSRLFVFVIGLSPIIVPLIIVGFGVFLLKKRQKKNKTDQI
ncbi:DUF4349 domain-containing protein [Salipaludibacillus sp. CF4.18]|uniref:DUF4349 domain-containing protein n=1 Tax=Salipaludibacillus sp. CF4.18 TaxID=3373081 RepID=UPI003EE6DC00